MAHKWLVLLSLSLMVACSSPQPDTRAPTGEWTDLPIEEWPRIAMVNRIAYTDSDHPMAGSAFLLDIDGEIVAATAKHVLRYFKSEAMDGVSFRGTLRRWEMFPKDLPNESTLCGELINEDDRQSLESIDAENDWLLFTVQQISEQIQPLRFRETPMRKGEAVYVVGWRYTDEGRQHVYPGEFMRYDEGSLLIDCRSLRDNTVPGLSGAPVIDARGELIGTMSSKAGKLQRAASIDYPQKVLARSERARSPDRTTSSAAEPPADCARRMTEHFNANGWVGITPGKDGAGAQLVEVVYPQSPAERAGVRQGDLIVDIRRTPQQLYLELDRNGEPLSITVRAEPIPENVLKSWIRQECPEPN